MLHAPPRPLVFGALAALCALLVAGCADTPSSPRSLQSGFAPSLDRTGQGGASGLTLEATGFNERRVDYDWSMKKRLSGDMVMQGDEMVLLPPPTEIHLPKGDAHWLMYDIMAKRSPTTVTAIGVRGEVCLTNNSVSQERPSVRAAVELSSTKQHEWSDERKDGHWTDGSTAIDVSDRPVLEAGETHCYPYEIVFSGVRGANYRIDVRASRHGSEDAGDDEQDDAKSSAADCATTESTFIVPNSVSSGAAVDGDAMLSDGMYPHFSPMWAHRADMTTRGPCAEHFYLYWCSTGYQDPWHLDGDADIMYVIDLHNTFGCGESFDLVNTAELVEGNSHTRRTAVSTVHVRPDPCPATPGCTWTDGYWKSRSHLWPDQQVLGFDNRDEALFFDTGRTWQQTLEKKFADGDTYSSLARQYIAATLNRANGANMASDLVGAYGATAHYFSVAPAERQKTSREELSKWSRRLQEYNDGHHGTPSCDAHEHEDDGREHFGSHSQS